MTSAEDGRALAGDGTVTVVTGAVGGGTSGRRVFNFARTGSPM